MIVYMRGKHLGRPTATEIILEGMHNRHAALKELFHREQPDDARRILKHKLDAQCPCGSGKRYYRCCFVKDYGGKK